MAGGTSAATLLLRVRTDEVERVVEVVAERVELLVDRAVLLQLLEGNGQCEIQVAVGGSGDGGIDTPEVRRLVVLVGELARGRELDDVAEDVGATIRLVDIIPGEFALDLDDLDAKLSDRTRVVAFGWASNAVGSVTDAAAVVQRAHAVGALAWVDATHYAAHHPLQAAEIGADVLLCSAYKFCGPHLGLAYVDPAAAGDWRPYKTRPGGSTPFGRRFETGTVQFELLAGLIATDEYLSSIGTLATSAPHERRLVEAFLEGLPEEVELYGTRRADARVATFLINLPGIPAADAARNYDRAGISVLNHDHYYSLGLEGRRGYEHEAIRLGFAHYTTLEEVEEFLAVTRRLLAGSTHRPARPGGVGLADG